MEESWHKEAGKTVCQIVCCPGDRPGCMFDFSGTPTLPPPPIQPPLLGQFKVDHIPVDDDRQARGNMGVTEDQGKCNHEEICIGFYGLDSMLVQKTKSIRI